MSFNIPIFQHEYVQKNPFKSLSKLGDDPFFDVNLKQPKKSTNLTVSNQLLFEKHQLSTKPKSTAMQSLFVDDISTQQTKSSQSSEKIVVLPTTSGTTVNTVEVNKAKLSSYKETRQQVSNPFELILSQPARSIDVGSLVMSGAITEPAASNRPSWENIAANNNSAPLGYYSLHTSSKQPKNERINSNSKVSKSVDNNSLFPMTFFPSRFTSPRN